MSFKANKIKNRATNQPMIAKYYYNLLKKNKPERRWIITSLTEKPDQLAKGKFGEFNPLKIEWVELIK